MNDLSPPSPPSPAAPEQEPDSLGTSGGAELVGADSGMAAHALRAALRYFQLRLRAQEARLGRLQRRIDAQAAALAHCQAALDQLRSGTSRPDPAQAGREANAGPDFPGTATATLPEGLQRGLRHIARRLRRMVPRAWRRALFAPPPTPVDPNDYRVRMRARHASGELASIRTVVLVAPRRLHRAALAVAELINAMSLRCSVCTDMPDRFTDDLYVVLSPAAFAHLPPSERRILWLVESGDLDETGSAALFTELNSSLAVFEAVQPRIGALQARGLLQHQIFHVPLSPFTAPHPLRADLSPLGLPHMLARALHGCGVLDDDGFEAATARTCLEGAALVLCLPEAPERFAHARESLRHGALLFPGLRNVDGWKGTAASYRYLARRALSANRTRLIIWEDDARLPDDFAGRLPTLLAQLEARADGWDLFSGLITDLSPRGNVTAVRPYGDDLLIEVNTVVGMVFGIYGPKALQALAAYRPEGDDVMKATIDRYLEALGLRCWTLFPPLVDHAEHLPSSLWAPAGQGFLGNDAFNAMIDGSQLRLLAKVASAVDGTPPPERR